MLEIGKESEKMKAMKGIIEEIAKGLDQSQYFPNVVKLVVSKSLEVCVIIFFSHAHDTPQLRKLVYMYLVRYAEDVPDIALLSVGTFQKGIRVCLAEAALFSFELVESLLRCIIT